jgi:hypothetical protein
MPDTMFGTQRKKRQLPCTPYNTPSNHVFRPLKIQKIFSDVEIDNSPFMEAWFKNNNKEVPDSPFFGAWIKEDFEAGINNKVQLMCMRLNNTGMYHKKFIGCFDQGEMIFKLE